MRVVLDTNVLVRAHAKATGPARKALLSVVSGPHVLVLSPFLLDETERVLNYPRVRLVSRLTPEEIQLYMQFLSSVGKIAHPASGSRVVLADPDDDAVIQTAVAGRAEFLCTLDRDFYKADVKAFCSNRGIRIGGDVELLRALAGSSHGPA